MKLCARWKSKCSARSEKGVSTRIAERARCCIRNFSIETPGRLTDSAIHTGTPGRVVGFHTRTSGGFKPGERWTVRETNCETVTLERDGRVRQFRPSAKGKWDVLAPSTMQVSVGDQIRVTTGFRETSSKTT